MIQMILDAKNASALITLIGQLSPKDLSHKCVSQEHRLVIENFYEQHRDQLPWPKDEYGKPE